MRQMSIGLAAFIYLHISSVGRDYTDKGVDGGQAEQKKKKKKKECVGGERQRESDEREKEMSPSPPFVWEREE